MSKQNTSVINLNEKPYSQDQTAILARNFYQDGFLYIPSVLSSTEVTALKDAVDEVFSDPTVTEQNRLYGDFVAVRLFETARVFEDMLTREPIISLVESILGKDCHLVAENIVRNKPGQALDNFHVDDLLVFPIGEGMQRHDSRLQMPVFILTVQIPLTDIPSVEYGPTEYVPGSHYSGRHPDSVSNPVFEDQHPIPILCKAGDMYVHNGQCWHRGAPNMSNRTRYLFQLSYGMRWVSQRLYPFVNYQLPEHVLANADDRRKRALGFHRKGAYG